MLLTAQVQSLLGGTLGFSESNLLLNGFGTFWGLFAYLPGWGLETEGMFSVIAVGIKRPA